ncbi:60 kDa inner membrane insertion protein [Sphaerotilus natans subsp. natans DSM 6575]|uniref:Membrane protein insertase YidC n=1 Tax=Sphaerotilus natans subsp. natans DSM 6575 TaxID=1286631 RepID=A0A059KLA8_9BURK|nr:membrane protein insertase YidC [Sphaerotilus natans]KDB51888.1 60 kDa inner membrane insertion protein [Sphaerotilus natans subsp. natans DSM 6575]SIQ19089.1 protein translocase subunit yidC [Sphaerotilus natans]
MTDTRRALLWGIFSVSLVMLWDGWNKHNGQPSMFAPPVAASAAAAGSAPGVPAAPAQPAGVAPLPGLAAGGEPSRTIDISTDLVRASIDTRGASLVGLTLPRYRDEHDTSKPVVLFDRSAQRVYQADSGLIPQLAGQAALPNHTTPMTLVPGPLKLADGQNELAVSFESAEQGGVKLRKTYVFKRGDYAVRVRHEVVNTSAAPVAAQLYLQLARDGTVPSTSIFMGPAAFTGPAVYTDAAKFQKVEFDKIESGKAAHEKSADNGWIAMVQHHFVGAWVFNDKIARSFQTKREGTNLYSVAMTLPVDAIAPGATKTVETTLYAGPQEEKKLEALAPGLELVKDYGWVTMLAKPLFWLLDKLHGLIGNWGWSIVALVVLLKIAFYWLNASAYRSMGKMKAVNPKIMEIRERHKADPQKMQQEMMRIYREEKVNPLGGCLPIFIQMPFFIALYSVLLASVEMRGAPWIGWITDLSVQDPYYILPALMTATTLFQTWLNPTPPDPVQAKMMWIMPLLFSVMFIFFPAGLVLYWFVNNLLSIAQQWMINRQLGLNR